MNIILSVLYEIANSSLELLSLVLIRRSERLHAEIRLKAPSDGFSSLWTQLTTLRNLDGQETLGGHLNVYGSAGPKYVREDTFRVKISWLLFTAPACMLKLNRIVLSAIMQSRKELKR